MRTVLVPENVNEERCDKILAQITGLPRSVVKKSFYLNKVFIDGQIVDPTHKVSNGMSIEFDIEEPSKASYDSSFKLDILFEDEDIIAVNKPAGITVHSAPGIHEMTLVDYVLNHCKLSYLGDKSRPGVVHRLDNETSGVIVFAKSNRAFKQLSRDFFNHEVEKVYKCIINGVPNLNTGVIDLPIARKTFDKTKMTTCSSGKPSKTSWILDKTFRNFSSLDVKIVTGRTHQIRVHMSAIGHPVAGDFTYLPSHLIEKNQQFPRVMLHAHHLKIYHPTAGHLLSLEAPIPEDFRHCIQELENENISHS